MKQLFLIRHAEAAWPSAPQEGQIETQADFDKPLTALGHDQARLLGQYIKQEKIRPNEIVCSTAKRTTETLIELSKVAENLKIVSCDFSRKYYLCGWDFWLGLIKSFDERLNTVMIVAHGPDLHGLSHQLVQDEKLNQFFPLAGLIGISIADNWVNCDLYENKVTHYFQPEV